MPLSRLLEIYNLPDNWCHNGDIPPTLTTISQASFWAGYCEAKGFNIDFVPNSEGGIELIGVISKYSFTLELYDNNILSYREEIGLGFDYEEISYLEKPDVKSVYNKLISFRERYKI